MKENSFYQFFLLRITECFNKNTIDSYRVRSNNAITLLYETRDVIDNWCKHRIKSFETVKYVLEECDTTVSKASCLTFENCPKDLLSNTLREYKQSDGRNYIDASHLLYYIDLCIEENSNSYLKRLFDSLKEILVSNELKEENQQSLFEVTDRQITELACELIRLGYSKIYLFSYFQSLVKEMTTKGYDEFFNKFDELSKHFISCTYDDYSVIFILSVPKKSPSIDGLVERIPEDILEKIEKDKKKQFQPSNNRKFCIKSIKALDEGAAIKLVREEISQILDYSQNGPEHQTIRIPYNAFVGYRDINGNVEVYKSRIVYSLDVSWGIEQDSITNLSTAMEKIESKSSVDNESRSRLKSALRHLRIGDGQLEMEQRFINYWIGLEFLFSSPEVSDATFTRMKKYLISIMASCYIKRNIMNLVDWMKDFGCSTEVFKDDQHIDQFIANNDINSLMFYRLKRMKMHLHHSDKTEDYIVNHKCNLEQHLARLYRLRNELVHEGAIKRDMENLTSNLRYYLVFVLNQCIDYFVRDRLYDSKISMDTFFWEYEKYQQIFSMNKKANFKFEYIIKVPLSNKYLR